MEYRMKYRDIPWSIAFAVLPGKIIGIFFARPLLKLFTWLSTDDNDELVFFIFMAVSIFSLIASVVYVHFIQEYMVLLEVLLSDGPITSSELPIMVIL